MLPPVTKEWQTFQSSEFSILQLKLGRTKKIIGRHITHDGKHGHPFVLPNSDLNIIKARMIFSCPINDETIKSIIWIFRSHITYEMAPAERASVIYSKCSEYGDLVTVDSKVAMLNNAYIQRFLMRENPLQDLRHFFEEVEKHNVFTKR